MQNEQLAGNEVDPAIGENPSPGIVEVASVGIRQVACTDNPALLRRPITTASRTSTNFSTSAQI